MRKVKVFVAGPYTGGDVAQNVQRAILTADALLNAGYVPFVPHLMHFWHFLSPHPYNTWTDYDNEWLPLCDVVWRMEGESSGTEAEVKLARAHNIPVVQSFLELRKLDPKPYSAPFGCPV